MWVSAHGPCRPGEPRPDPGWPQCGGAGEVSAGRWRGDSRFPRCCLVSVVTQNIDSPIPVPEEICGSRSSGRAALAGYILTDILEPKWISRLKVLQMRGAR